MSILAITKSENLTLVSGTCNPRLPALIYSTVQYAFCDFTKLRKAGLSIVLVIRGGVEDTGLEAKAKDTKKSEAKAKDSLSEDRPSRGQGQECSRPRPRTKNTAASVLQKKGLQQSFSGNLQFIGVARIFDWGGLNHKSHAMTSSKICLLALNQDFAKGKGLN